MELIMLFLFISFYEIFEKNIMNVSQNQIPHPLFI